MDRIYNFNTCRRLLCFLDALPERDIPFDQFLRRYIVCAGEDLQLLARDALPHFFDFESDRHDRFAVRLDESNLRVDTRMVQRADRCEITVSLGAMLAIDDATGVLTRWWHPSREVLWDRIDEQRFVEPKFLDYGFLLDERVPGGPANLLYACPVIFIDKEAMEQAIIGANFSLLWLLLHEIGHVQLGHLRELGLHGADGPEQVPWSRSGSNLGSGIRLAQEFAADVYASNRFFATFVRKDAIASILPVSARSSLGQSLCFLLTAAGIPLLLLHRSQKSVAGGGQSPVGDYPDATVRLFNLMACISPALDENRKFLHSVHEITGVPNYACDVHMEDLIGPLMLHIGLFDRFLQYLNAIPLLPWRLHGEMHILESGLQARYRYGPVDPTIISGAESEIVAAALAACRGVAEFKSHPGFSQTYDRWLGIVRSCWERWGPLGLEGPEARSFVESLLYWDGNPDVQRMNTIHFFLEVTSTSSSPDRDRYVEDFRALVERLNSFKQAYAAS